MDIDKLEELEKSINARLYVLLNDSCYNSDGYISFHTNSIIKDCYVEIFKTTLDLIKDFKCMKAWNILLRNNTEMSSKDNIENCRKEFDNGIVKRIEELERIVDQLKGIK